MTIGSCCRSAYLERMQYGLLPRYAEYVQFERLAVELLHIALTFDLDRRHEIGQQRNYVKKKAPPGRSPPMRNRATRL